MTSHQVEERAAGAPGPATEVELSVSGMTCGSCAARVQKVLARQAGVERAAVNFATGRASVVFDPSRVAAGDLVAAVGKIGYGLAPAEPPADAAGAEAEDVLERMWLRRVLVAWPLGLTVLVLSLWLMHEPWARWSAFALTVPVQFWAGYPFLHQAALRARARQANMDT
ncbi:MAG: cation transporter, partial [Actinomycetota bacterium]